MDGGYWIPERDNGHRMWRCSRCDRRMVGSVWDENFNPYRYCPYCGSHNQTEQGEQLRMDGEGGQRADGGRNMAAGVSGHYGGGGDGNGRA